MHEDPAANAVLVDLDRCPLRSWSLPASEQSGFGELELPRDETAAWWLRSALAAVARGRRSIVFREVEPEWLQRFVAVALSGRHQLMDALAQCNEALLGDLDRRPAGRRSANATAQSSSGPRESAR